MERSHLDQFIGRAKITGKKNSQHLAIHQYELLRRFSSYKKLQRVIAYCCRFINIKVKKAIIHGPLTVKELEESKLRILAITQEEAFPRELADLQAKEDLDKKNHLSLNTFLRTDGLLRVGGRLRNTEILYA